MSPEMAGIGGTSRRRRGAKFENGFRLLGSIRVLISVGVAWGLFCERVGTEMGVREWSERENGVRPDRRKIELRGICSAQIRTTKPMGIDCKGFNEANGTGTKQNG